MVPSIHIQRTLQSRQSEYLLARTVPQLLAYLSWHEVPLAYLSIDITVDQMNLVSAIPNDVHVRFDLVSILVAPSPTICPQCIPMMSVDTNCFIINCVWSAPKQFKVFV